jgi:hypothetical protein
MKIMKYSTKFLFIILAVILYGCDASFEKDAENSDGSTALNGSYTRMLIVKNRLYGVSNSYISTLDITDKKNPLLLNKQRLGFNVESIFHHEGVLFVGSSQQMFILKLDSRAVPVLESQTTYFDTNVQPCDPVFVSNQTAYVTLSPSTVTGITACGRRPGNVQTLQTGQLRIYDVTNIKLPELKTVIDVSDPKGLAVNGEYLFVCNADDGVNVYNLAKNKFTPELVYTTEPFKAYDVIVNQGIITVVGGENLHQYQLIDKDGKVSLQKLSTIEL